MERHPRQASDGENHRRRQGKRAGNNARSGFSDLVRRYRDGAGLVQIVRQAVAMSKRPERAE